ncbi:MAG: M23 family metallopeptidase [bacterium]
MKKSRRVTLLVVPDTEGTPLSFKLPLLSLRIALVFSGLVVVFLLVIAFSWFGLLRRAQLYDQVQAENEKLVADYQRIFKLEERVIELQKLESQVRKVLGVDALAGEASQFVLPPSLMQNPDVDASQVLSTSESFSFEPSYSSAASPYSFANHSVLSGADVPSLLPVEGIISKGFDLNEIVPTRSHYGVDIAGVEGTVIKAAAGGVVIWCGWSNQYGNLVALAHFGGYFTVYGHNRTLLVEPHQRVERGTPIALLGNSGESSAPHLHFEIWLWDQPINPLDMLTTS